MDKLSIKLLKELKKRDLSEDEVIRIVGETYFNQKAIYQLLSGRMISKHRSSGIPDGAGGYQPGTVRWIYRLEPNGKAEVDRVCKDRLLWLIGTGIALLSAIGAILSGLASWAC